MEKESSKPMKRALFLIGLALLGLVTVVTYQTAPALVWVLMLGYLGGWAAYSIWWRNRQDSPT